MPISLNDNIWITAGLGKPGKILTCISPPMLAYFRPSRVNADQAGPLNANEYIASRLGAEIEIPMAKIDFISHEEALGTISFLVAMNAQSWSNFPFRTDYNPYLTNPQQLIEMIVFDTWIHNEDRNQENLMFAKNIYTKKYDLYLIDNTEALYGSSKPTSRDITHFSASGVVKIDEFKKLLDNNYADFELCIAKIESMQDDKIKSIIDEVPTEFIVDDERDFIYNFLTSRKSGLRGHFQALINH